MRNAVGLFAVMVAAGFAGCAATAQVHASDGSRQSAVGNREISVALERPDQTPEHLSDDV